MKLADALRLPSLRAVTVVAGTAALEREIRWVHVVDIPEPAPWVRAGQLLLTTGYAWTADSRSMHRQIPKLAELGLTALGLAVPRYVPRFSATARREGDRVGLALLEIPWEIPFTQITEEVHRTILGEQAIAIERAEDIHRELTRVATEAAGLHDVAVTLGRLLNRSVAFEHANGTLLAHHSVAAVDAVRRQSIQRTATPKRIQRVLERDGYLDAIRRASSSVEIPAIPALGMAARLAAPIRLGGEFVGCVWIIQGDRPIGDLDRRAAEHAALIAALQIARLRELEAIEHRLGSDLVTALLDEGIEITPELLERATLHGFDPDAAYRVAVIVFDERNVDDPTRFRRLERFVVRLRRQIADRGIPPLVASTHREVAALLREDVPLSTLTDVIKDGPAPRVVVGRPARGIAGIRRSRAEAYALLAAGVPGVVADYEALLVPRTLLGDREARAALIESILGVLRRERNGDRLVETLDAFVAAGFTRAAAAERLGVHPNTLRYRLGRIERVLGIEFDNQQTRFTLQLVLYLLSISYKNDPPNL